MKHPSALLLLALVAATALPAQAQLLPQSQAGATASGTQPLDRIVAVVDENVILQSELDDAVRSVKQQYASSPGQLPPDDVLDRQVLDRLILMKLQVAKADDQGIRVSSADIDQAVSAVAQQNHMSPEQLQQAVEQSGQGFAAFRSQLADQLVVQRLHDSVVRDQVNITDSEINNLLASPAYKAGEVHLAHIQISIPAGGGAADIQAAQAKAQQALDAIKGGMDFHAAAIRYSDAQDALEGGDLGWRKVDEIPPAFADTIAGMKPGQVSAALRGPTGFHILKLIDQRAPGRQVVTEYHARQILIRPTELVTAEQAHQKAQDLYNRIVDKHEDFAKLAKENSKDPTTANAGGDMGWFQRDQWGSTVAQQLAQLKDGEVSQPFQSEAGWHIIQLEGTRKSDVTEESERNQARQAIGNRKAEQAYEDFLRQLRSDAYIDILVPALKDPDARANS
ncbi:MAG TPA: peptidylprolyl isomerase [Frateuria sp.]|uniref:peptidylprolyl isomerase n=1 Tax=Frateuria sp. TaxID=2211372 RepID=UPI002DF1C739|nr:peptidylprolyl isomerase [Frateuria sp.]